MKLALLALDAGDLPLRPGAAGGGRLPLVFEDVYVILGTGLLLLVLLLVWAKYLRKRPRRHDNPRVTYRAAGEEEQEGEEAEAHSHHHHHRRRHRRRRDHRVRNPTLAETGGLPPPRASDAPPPPAV